MITRRQIPSMLAAFGLLGTAAAIQSCSGSPTDQVIAWVKQNCGIIITVAAQVTAIINAMAGATVENVGKAICDAWNAQQAANAQLKTAAPGTKSQIVVVVNGHDYPVDVTKA